MPAASRNDCRRAAPTLPGLLMAWLVMLLVSVANGAIRDLSYGRQLDELTAHQLSTFSSVLLLGLVMRGFVHLCPPASGRQAMAIGLFWMVLTVAFEFLFFHFFAGHAWSELLANYNLADGRIWVLVLLWLTVAPYFFYRIGQ